MFFTEPENVVNVTAAGKDILAFLVRGTRLVLKSVPYACLLIVLYLVGWFFFISLTFGNPFPGQLGVKFPVLYSTGFPDGTFAPRTNVVLFLDDRTANRIKAEGKDFLRHLNDKKPRHPLFSFDGRDDSTWKETPVPARWADESCLIGLCRLQLWPWGAVPHTGGWYQDIVDQAVMAGSFYRETYYPYPEGYEGVGDYVRRNSPPTIRQIILPDKKIMMVIYQPADPHASMAWMMSGAFLAVGLPVATVLLLLGSYFLARIYRRRRVLLIERAVTGCLIILFVASQTSSVSILTDSFFLFYMMLVQWVFGFIFAHNRLKRRAAIPAIGAQ